MPIYQKLIEITNDLAVLKVEMVLMAGAILLLLAGIINPSKKFIKTLFFLLLCCAFWQNNLPLSLGNKFINTLYIDVYAQHFANLILFFSLFLLIYPRKKRHITECYFFVLSMLVGALFMMKANSLLIIFLSIELVSFTSYLLTNFSFKKESHEASIKYLIFGSITSGIMLLGMAILFGGTHTIYLSEWNEATLSHSLFSQLGLLLLILGVFFKIVIVPMHIWLPATYQTAPTDVTALLSVVPKLSALILLKRILDMSSIPNTHWMIQFILICGMITVLIGTFGALKQTHVRRMIALGSLAHSGFLLPFVVMKEAWKEAFWWYSIVYALMNLIVFYLLTIFENNKKMTLESYSGLGKSIPLIGIIFTVVLASLVGLPPMAGFMAKFFLFSSLWDNYQMLSQPIYMIYLLIAVFSTLLSLGFYMKIPYHFFLKDNEEIQNIKIPVFSKYITFIFSFILILLFFVPNLLNLLR